MRLSPFFEQLKSAYDAELEDLTTDSAGHDVLAKRLKEKRKQVPQLLPMIECNPEMVAVAFHGGMRFPQPELFNRIAALDPEDLPTWSLLHPAVELQPWATELAEVVLQDAFGDHFLVVTACLEYLQGKTQYVSDLGEQRSAEDEEAYRDGRTDDDEPDDRDLEEAGADWLSEQGFDRKDQFFGG